MSSTKKIATKHARIASSAKIDTAALDEPIVGESSRVGKRGTVVIPIALCRLYGIEEGTLVVAEPREGGVFIRPAASLSAEIYTSSGKLSSFSRTPLMPLITPECWQR